MEQADGEGAEGGRAVGTVGTVRTGGKARKKELLAERALADMVAWAAAL